MNDMTNDKLGIAIAYTKKARLDWLTNQVTDAQYQVNQFQTIVDAETAKSSQFNTFLSEADANRTSALTNLNLVKDVNSSVGSLVNSTKLAKLQTDRASTEITTVSSEIANLINKLIFSVELIVRFDQLVNKQKASNPLIPDTLISFMSKAVSDANNAIALTLTALQSCYAAEAASLQSQEVIKLEDKQVREIQQKIQRELCCPPEKGYVTGLTSDCTGVLHLSEQAYEIANEKYNQALADNNMVNQQLAHAKTQLATATTSLDSYKAGLAAATAAAYAA